MDHHAKILSLQLEKHGSDRETADGIGLPMGKLKMDGFEVLVKAMQSFLFECTSLMAQIGIKLDCGRHTEDESGSLYILH